MGLFGKKNEEDVESRFARFSVQMRYTSLIKLCEDSIKDARSDNERCFWVGQLSTVYTLYGEGSLANRYALSGAELAEQAGFMSGLIHCAVQLTVIPNSPEQMEKYTQILKRVAPENPASERADMIVTAMREGMPLKESMLLAIESTDKLGNAGRGQACAVTNMLLRNSEKFRLEEEEYRELLLYYSSNINMLANSARAALINTGDDDYREYLPILHPAIRLLKIYAGSNSYDEEIQIEYERICGFYGICGDTANKGRTAVSFESLNHSVQKCRHCGMPVTGDYTCLFCGTK